MSDNDITEVGVPDDGAENTPAGVAPSGNDRPASDSQPPMDGGVMGAVPENASIPPTGVGGDDELPPEEQGR